MDLTNLQKPLKVVPDSNFWISRCNEHDLRQLRLSHLVEIGCSDDIAEECATQENASRRRAATGRILELCDFWLTPKQQIIDDYVAKAQDPNREITPVIADTLDLADYKRQISELITTGNEAIFLKARERRKARQQLVKQEHQRVATEYYNVLMKLPTSHPERTTILNLTSEELTLKCLNPGDDFGGLHLDIILRDYGYEPLSTKDRRSLCRSLPYFPGVRYFYAHIMINIFDSIKTRSIPRAVDPSFSADAQIMIQGGPAHLVLSNDKGLNKTRLRVFANEVPLVRQVRDFIDSIGAKK